MNECEVRVCLICFMYDLYRVEYQPYSDGKFFKLLQN